MRQITKTSPPQAFVDFCQTPDVIFRDLSGAPKRALRKRLLEDQGYICCYCGRRIEDNGDTKIEHILCQQNHGDLQLDFSNMLASCDGGQNDRTHPTRGTPRHEPHCDAKKGNDELPISPLDNVEGILTYHIDGTVKGQGKVGRELIRILGLDAKFLNSQRKNAIESYNLLAPKDLEAELIALRTKKNGKFEEFCFVLEQHIKDLMNGGE